MKALRPVLLVLTLSTPSVPAHAAEIGLLGGDFDPQSIFDPTFNDLEFPCPTPPDELPITYFCALYEILPAPPGQAEFVINSIDFRLLDPSGGYFDTGDIGVTLFADVENSDLDNFGASPLFDDGITFRLSDNSISCPPHCDAAFFASDGSVASVSVVGVNGIANPDPIPEPATLFLVGPAWAALAVRRAWRKARREPKITSTGTSSRAV